MPIPLLGVTVANRQGGGAEIVNVMSGSVADLAYIHPGDVINEVDGKKVKTPMELAAELSGKTPGSKIRIGYMYKSDMMGIFAEGNLARSWKKSVGFGSDESEPCTPHVPRFGDSGGQNSSLTLIEYLKRLAAAVQLRPWPT
jgi:hypothetical protein